MNLITSIASKVLLCLKFCKEIETKAEDMALQEALLVNKMRVTGDGKKGKKNIRNKYL